MNGTPVSIDPRMVGVELKRFNILLEQEGVFVKKDIKKNSTQYTFKKYTNP
jgi:hypothetical protein